MILDWGCNHTGRHSVRERLGGRVRGRDEVGGSREVVFVPGDVVITCGQPRLLNFLDPFGTDAD